MICCSSEMFKCPRVRTTWTKFSEKGNDYYLFHDGQKWNKNFNPLGNQDISFLDEYMLSYSDLTDLETLIYTPRDLRIILFQQFDTFSLDPPLLTSSMFHQMEYEDFLLDKDCILERDEFIDGKVIGCPAEMTFREFLVSDESIIREEITLMGDYFSLYWRLKNSCFEKIPAILKN